MIITTIKKAWSGSAPLMTENIKTGPGRVNEFLFIGTTLHGQNLA